MNDVERLKQWMGERSLTYRTLADATGDTHSTVNMIVNGRRDINDAFRWRFRKAFGDKEANDVFVDQLAPASEVTL